MTTSTFFVPTQVVVGPGSLDQLPALIKQYGKHVLLVHGHHPVEDGLLESVRTILNKENIPHTNLGEILPNPKYDSVKRGVKAAKDAGCDIILSLGGGSTLQCAKGIAYGLKHEDHLWDLWTGKAKAEGAAPVCAILTNPASGDELNDSCTLVKEGKEKTFKSRYGHCCFAILDPTLSELPLYPTMCEAFEMFVYIFSRYLDAPDLQADIDMTLMKNLLETTNALKKDSSDVEARTNLFWIGLLSHSIHQSSTSTFSDLTGRLAFAHSLANGAAMSALFFAWVSELAKTQTAKIARLGNDLFSISTNNEATDATLCLRQMKKQVEAMGLPVSIPDTGLVLEDKDLKSLANTDEEIQILKQSNQ